MKRITLGRQKQHSFVRDGLLRPILASAFLIILSCNASSQRLPAVSGSSRSETTSKSWQELLVEADSLRTRWTAASWREAIKKYQAVLLKLRQPSLRREEARVLGSLGLAYVSVRKPLLAQRSLARSLAIRHELKAADSEMVDTLNNLTNSLILSSNYEQARTYCKESLDLSRSLGYVKGEGWALELTGQVEYFSGDLLKSLEFYTASLTPLKKANDKAGLAQAYLDLGYSYSDLSETEKAMSFLDQALVSSVPSATHGSKRSLSLLWVTSVRSSVRNKRHSIFITNPFNYSSRSKIP